MMILPLHTSAFWKILIYRTNFDAHISCEIEVKILIVCQRTCFKGFSMG